MRVACLTHGESVVISVFLLPLLTVNILLSFAPIHRESLAQADFEGNRSNKILSLPTLNRTAIVYATKYLSDCKAIRLEHLLQTAPPNMDVWFFHNHDILNDKDKGQSMRYLKKFEDKYGLKNLNQERTRTMGNFDGSSRTGTSKSSFLKFVRTHPEYDYAWIVEDDVMITGGWRIFFERYGDDDADFISQKIGQNRDWHWYHHGCNFDEDYILEGKLNHNDSLKFKNSTQGARVNCIQLLNWAAMWPLIRVSQKGAKHLMEDLLSGLIQGHHEAIVQAILLRYQALKFSSIPSEVAEIHGGGWGPWKNSTNLKLDLFQPISMGYVYHPVKCEAYMDLGGTEEFEKLMTKYGWKKNGTSICR
ncbi:hypothetical protein IV203_027963 [Nitzschia inconspicua]|uniref:Uncharacterized protein n=1 Tax=Nitzschia inconspicua TaxID=303405 RepID=A0A9K3LXN4_9STRA|nr:hypothetical protein IV203_027963 [Nitzschia inconspicua]